MSLKRCLPELLASGAFTKDQHDRLKDVFDQLEREYQGLGPTAAAAMASAEAVRRFESDAQLKRRQAALQIKAQQQIAFDVRKFRIDRPGAAAEAILAADDRAPYFNVEFRARAIADEHFALINGILAKHSRNVIGQVRDVAGLHDVLREAFGEHTGNAAAKELGQAWLAAAESLRLQFNMAGGAIGKIEKWGMPQVHNMMAVRAAPFDEWRDFTAPLLDRQKMLDGASGEPLTAQQLQQSLRAVYDTIASDGWNERRAGAFSGSKVANRHQDSRFLIFKDADSWLAYHNRFGRPLSSLSEIFDPGAAIFDAMVGHVHGMSRDIALMQRLGPNPAATMRWLKDGLVIEAMTHSGGGRIKRAKSASIRLDNMYRELTGGWDVEYERLAKFMEGARSLESAAKLGSAVFHATTDVATHLTTRWFNGMSATKTIADYIGSLKPESAADKAQAARMLFVADRAIHTMGSYALWTGETMNGEIPARLSDAVMRLSYMAKWTDDGRKLFNREVWSTITDNAGRKWENLSPRFRRMLDRYGINGNHWDTIRSTPLEEDGGAHWILPKNIKDQALSRRLAEMILQESAMVAHGSSLAVRAGINARYQKGSIPGELGRELMQFRWFPVRLLYLHGRRMLESSPLDAVKYAAILWTSATLMGALALQLKQFINGQDPLPMNDPEFLGRAAEYGGGWGIAGDLIPSKNQRLPDYIAEQSGPLVSTGVDVGNIYYNRNHGRALVQAIKNNTPGSTLFYTRLAFEREVLDNLQRQVDPDYDNSWAKMEARAQKNGTDFWWRPGESVPDRAPNASNAAEKR